MTFQNFLCWLSSFIAAALGYIFCCMMQPNQRPDVQTGLVLLFIMLLILTIVSTRYSEDRR